MGFLIIPILVIYLMLGLISIAVAIKFGRSKLIVFVVILFFTILPFRRLIFYKIIFFYYSRTPLKEIHETVQYPISVYWEDNVLPGFDEYGRHWMVKNYLDGEHLQLLALSGEDGKIYLYRVNQETYSKSKALHPEYLRVKQAIETSRKEAVAVGSSGGDNKAMWDKIREREQIFRKSLAKQYEEQREKEIAGVLVRVVVYADKTDLPPIRYHVEFNRLPISFLLNNQNNILHADKISIVDTDTDKEIAYSKRYLAYAGLISRINDEQPRFDYKLGDFNGAYKIDDKVLFEYAGVRSSYDSGRNNLKH